MKLREYEGKEMFRTYGIMTPVGHAVSRAEEAPAVKGKVFAKAQVLAGDRKKEGGIIGPLNQKEVRGAVRRLLGKKIRKEIVENVLIEEAVDAAKEYYVSFTYDGGSGGPVLALSPRGGSGISKAHIVPVNLLWGVPGFFLRDALIAAGFPQEDIGGVTRVIQSLWELFTKEYALIAEINPLFKTKAGAFVAGDAKVVIDDEKVNPNEKHFIEMDGDIAILASGGGASMLCMDALLRAGGRPANYTEYSGNPPASVVKEMTARVLGRPGIKGCWIVGAAANFTDIYETLSGFLEGLREIHPKPKYPIVIRRDGPRRQEAFEMLRRVGAEEGYDFHLYDSSTPMIATAKIMTKLMKQRS